MADIDPVQPPPGFTAVLVFDDPTPNAIIVNRISKRMIQICSQCTDLGKPENQQDARDFCDIVIIIARKMVSVWNHLEAYHSLTVPSGLRNAAKLLRSIPPD